MGTLLKAPYFGYDPFSLAVTVVSELWVLFKEIEIRACAIRVFGIVGDNLIDASIRSLSSLSVAGFPIFEMSDEAVDDTKTLAEEFLAEVEAKEIDGYFGAIFAMAAAGFGHR